MSVFICWSDKRSHSVATALKKLLHTTVPALRDDEDVFVSDSIDKGVAWFDSIVRQLNSARAGVVCLTAENLRSPWMHFEAGALARRLSDMPRTVAPTAFAAQLGGVHAQGGTSSLTVPGVNDLHTGLRHSAHRNLLFTVLHGVSPAEIEGPLSAYQGTSTTRRDMTELVRALSSVLGDPLPADGPPIIGDKPWAEFEGALRRAAVPVRTLVSGIGRLFQRKTFNEPLHQCADQAWLARYEGARMTRETLTPHLERIKAACPVHEHGLFEMLLTELDAYAMAIQALLLTPRQFRLGDSGELQMEPGVRTCCEDRRLAIRSLVGRLLNPLDAPLLPEAVRFMAAETNEERKMIVHRLEGRIRREREETYEDVFKGSNRQSAVMATLERLTRDLLENHIEPDEAGQDEDDREETSAPAVRAAATPGSAPEPADVNATNHASARLISFRQSSWDLDRIYYYLLVQYFDVDALRWELSGRTALSREEPDALADGAASVQERAALDHDLFCAARDVEMEIERYRARSKGGSLMPLTYALVALEALEPAKAVGAARVHAAITSALSLVKEELAPILRTDEGRPIARLLAGLW